MAGLVKTIAMSIIADPGDSHAVLDDLTAKGDKLRRPIDVILTADGAEAKAGVDEVNEAFSAYIDAAVEAEKASANFAKVQGEAAADSAEYRAALDASTEATLAAADAQMRLLEAEQRAEVGAKAAGDEQVAAAAKTEESAGVFDGLGAKMMLGSTAMLGLAAGIGGVGYESVKMATEFQRSMELLVTQAGVPQQKLASLKAGVLQVAAQVGMSPDSLAESLYHVSSNMESMGASGPKMLNALRVAAEGAQVGAAPLVDVTNALTAAIASGIPGVNDYQKAMGALNATVGSGDMTMEDLAQAFGTGMVATVKGFGLTITDVGAALATFGDNNIRGAKAGTELRMAVQALGAPGTGPVAVAALQKLDLTYTQLSRDMQKGGLKLAIVDLANHLRAAGFTGVKTGEILTDAFGKKAGSGINILIGQEDRFLSKYPALAKGANGFSDAWKRTQQTVSVELKQLEGRFDQLMITIGDKVLPPATRFLGLLARNSGTVLLLAKGVGLLVGALGIFTATSKVAAAAAAMLDVELDANPIGLVVLAIAGLVIGLVELYKHFKIIRDVVADVGHYFVWAWHNALHVAGDVIKWFDAGPLKWMHQNLAILSKFWKQNGAEIMKIVRVYWDEISMIFKAVMGVIMTVIKVAWDGIVTVFKVAWDIISGIVKIAWDVIGTIIQTALKVITNGVGFFMQLFQGHWTKAWSYIRDSVHVIFGAVGKIIHDIGSGFVSILENVGRDMIKGLIKGIEDMLGGLFGVVKGIGHGISGAFGDVLKIFSPSKVFYEHGMNIVLGLQHGIEDYGPHAVAASAHMATAVSGAAASSAAVGTRGGAGGDTYVFNVAPLTDPDKTAREIQQMLIRLKRNRGQTALGLA